MKYLKLVTLLFALPFMAKAQKSDCKLVKMKMGDGTTSMMVRAPGALGIFMVGKYNGNSTMFYSTKELLASDPSNKAVLRIDSVKFVFVDNSVLALKAFSGIGTLANVNREMQPHITNAQFSLALGAGSKEELKFKQTKLKAFLVVAEKGAVYGDNYNETQQETLMKSFDCVK
jgi:hypothetical protein